jgi:DNA-binding MarR family transcriptional regulator
MMSTRLLFEVLLLVFVKFGVTTPYDLLSQGGMSVGLTSPALKRMEQAGLLTSTPGPRKRTRYAMTERGDAALRASLNSGRKNCWGLGRFGIFESVPRTILLAWVHSGLEDALDCVDRAAKELRIEGQKREREAEELRNSVLSMDADLFKDESVSDRGIRILTVYRWIKAASDAACSNFRPKRWEQWRRYSQNCRVHPKSRETREELGKSLLGLPLSFGCMR